MQALILNDQPQMQIGLTLSLVARGFHVINSESISSANSYVRMGVIDLLVMNDRICGSLTHAVALSAEHRNPNVRTVMITMRDDCDTDELYDLIPSLVSLVGTAIEPRLIAQIGLAAVTGAARPVAHEPQPEVVAGVPRWDPNMPLADMDLHQMDTAPDAFADVEDYPGALADSDEDIGWEEVMPMIAAYQRDEAAEAKADEAVQNTLMLVDPVLPRKVIPDTVLPDWPLDNFSRLHGTAAAQRIKASSEAVN